MESNDYVIGKLRKDITEQNLQIKAVIQDINSCTGPMAELHNLNSAGRLKIAALRKNIDKFADFAKENMDKDLIHGFLLLQEVVLFREQMSSSMEAFRKANVKSMLAIEKSAKDELFKPVNEETALRQRQKRDKEGLVKMTSSVTDQLLSISRDLAATTQRSADTLDTLITSSDTASSTQDELRSTSGTINQSGKLLAKYGRREFTDKIIVFFAFAFFCACVLYIVQKRLF